MRAALLGPPGAGKGTQAARLAAGRGVAHIATGDILRAAVAAGTALGRQAQGYMERGALVPDGLMIDLMRERLGAADAAVGFLLDGFPRTLAQAEALDELLAGLARPLERVVELAVPEAVVVERLSGRRTCPACQATYHVRHAPPRREGVCDRCGGSLVQRPDDREETVRERLSVYRLQTLPLLSYYEARRILVRVDGDAPPDEVAARLLEALPG